MRAGPGSMQKCHARARPRGRRGRWLPRMRRCPRGECSGPCGSAVVRVEVERMIWVHCVVLRDWGALRVHVYIYGAVCSSAA
jgi:hypothetical protein